MLVTYQTIINEVNQIPIMYLNDVYKMLHSYQVRVSHKEENRAKILEFAGAWSDFSEKDFWELNSEIQRSRNEMFSREIEL